jgi:hypothetical protein
MAVPFLSSVSSKIERKILKYTGLAFFNRIDINKEVTQYPSL